MKREDKFGLRTGALSAFFTGMLCKFVDCPGSARAVWPKQSRRLEKWILGVILVCHFCACLVPRIPLAWKRFVFLFVLIDKAWERVMDYQHGSYAEMISDTRCERETDNEELLERYLTSQHGNANNQSFLEVSNHSHRAPICNPLFSIAFGVLALS